MKAFIFVSFLEMQFHLEWDKKYDKQQISSSRWWCSNLNEWMVPTENSLTALPEIAS